jgi:hypothetical protein
MNDEHPQTLSLKAAYAFGAAKGLEAEVDAIRDMVIEWDSSYTSSLRRGYIVELFERHGIFEDFKEQHWPRGNTGWGESRRLRFLTIKLRYEEFLRGDPIDTEFVSEDTESQTLLFPLESHLRDFIIANLGSLKIQGHALHLYQDPSSGKNGKEYHTEVGNIDILAQDGEGNLVVFELKLSKGPDRAVGQALRYMGWVSKHLAVGKKVTGVIVAQEIDEKLKYAVSLVPSITVFEYSLRFDLHQVSLS